MGAVGKIERADGNLILARFPSDQCPKHLSRLFSNGIELCVVRVQSGGLVQVVPVTAGSWWTGQDLVDTSEPFLGAIPDEIASRLMGPSGASGARLQTGVKSIDLFASLTQNGRLGLFCDWNSGAMVLVPELSYRIDKPFNRQTLLVFTPPLVDWEGTLSEIVAGSDPVPIYYVPVANPMSAQFAESVSGLDSRLFLSRALVEQSIYPTVDPLRSSGTHPDS